MILCDLIYNKNAIDPTAADNEPLQNAEGRAAWRRGVIRYKAMWGNGRNRA